MLVKFEFWNISRFSCIWKKNCKDFGKNTVMCWYNIAYTVNLFIFHYIFNSCCSSSTISYTSKSIINFSSTFVFFIHTCYTNPSTERKLAQPISQVSMHLFWKLSNISSSSSVSLCTYRSWYWHSFSIWKTFQTLLAYL